MSPNALGLILASVSLTAFAQLALKLSSARHANVAEGAALLPSLFAQMLNPWTMAGLFGYVGSFVLWLLALREVPLTIAYPFMGLTLVLVALLGVAVLGETLGVWELVGFVIVLGAAAVINAPKRAAAEPAPAVESVAPQR